MTSTNIYQPYTYLIGWSHLNLYYYGVRYKIGCNPTDLMNTYFTSSATVKKYIKSHGLPDVKQIRKLFTNKDSAQKWEDKVIRRLRVPHNSKLLNRNRNNKAIAFTTTGLAAAKDHNGNKLGAIPTSDPRWKTGEIVSAIKGIKRTDETKERIRKVTTGVKQSAETIEKRISQIIGKTPAKLVSTGEFIGNVSVNDFRFETGEIVNCNKGIQKKDKSAYQLGNNNKAKRIKFEYKIYSCIKELMLEKGFDSYAKFYARYPKEMLEYIML